MLNIFNDISFDHQKKTFYPIWNHQMDMKKYTTGSPAQLGCPNVIKTPWEEVAQTCQGVLPLEVGSLQHENFIRTDQQSIGKHTARWATPVIHASIYISVYNIYVYIYIHTPPNRSEPSYKPT